MTENKTEFFYETPTEEGLAEEKPKFQKKTLNWQMLLVVGFAVWFALAGVAAFGLNSKLNRNNQELRVAMDTALAELEKSNLATLESLEQKLAEMTETVAVVTGSIATTDQSLASAGTESRAEMAKQIKALGKELDSLRASLKILQEKK